MPRQSPYKHSDGSNCWTKNCSRGNSKTSHNSQVEKLTTAINKALDPTSNNYKKTLELKSAEVEGYIVDNDGDNYEEYYVSDKNPPELTIYRLDNEGDEYVAGRVIYNIEKDKWISNTDQSQHDDLHEAVLQEKEAISDWD
jgi:hypothetical protein